MGRNLSNGEKPFDWSQLKFLCYWHYEECWTQFSCNNCIHPFKAFMLSTNVKEDATKNHKFHIPFSWIKSSYRQKLDLLQEQELRHPHSPILVQPSSPWSSLLLQWWAHQQLSSWPLSLETRGCYICDDISFFNFLCGKNNLSKIFITFISCIPNAFMIRPNMLLQLILSSKRVITFYTQIPNVFMSRFNMHLQLIFSIKWFFTFFTWIPNVFMIRWFYCTNGIIIHFYLKCFKHIGHKVNFWNVVSWLDIL